MNGTFTFDVDDDDIEMQIWTITKISTSNKKEDNSYWVYGEDFTIEDCEVHSREGKTFPVTIGTNANNPSVLTYDGGSVVLRMVPSAAHQEEGYIFANDGRTVTGNTTIQTKIPLGGLFSSTCPADAEIAMMQKPGGDAGSGTIHFVPFRLIAPESVETSGETKTYTWRLGNTCKYNMRAWKEGGLTQLLNFYFNTDPAKCPVINFTEADFAARDPKWIDHDPQSLDGLNDCNILLNINEKGYLKMTAGQEYDLMAERDWQIIPNQTENYFLEPDYHYAVYNMNGQPDNSVVEIVPDGNIGSEWSILRAKSAGTAIVTVTYDAASALQFANRIPITAVSISALFGRKTQVSLLFPSMRLLTAWTLTCASMRHLTKTRKRMPASMLMQSTMCSIISMTKRRLTTPSNRPACRRWRSAIRPSARTMLSITPAGTLSPRTKTIPIPCPSNTDVRLCVWVTAQAITSTRY